MNFGSNRHLSLRNRNCYGEKGLSLTDYFLEKSRNYFLWMFPKKNIWSWQQCVYVNNLFKLSSVLINFSDISRKSFFWKFVLKNGLGLSGSFFKLVIMVFDLSRSGAPRSPRRPDPTEIAPKIKSKNTSKGLGGAARTSKGPATTQKWWENSLPD